MDLHLYQIRLDYSRTTNCSPLRCFYHPKSSDFEMNYFQMLSLMILLVVISGFDRMVIDAGSRSNWKWCNFRCGLLRALVWGSCGSFSQNMVALLIQRQWFASLHHSTCISLSLIVVRMRFPLLSYLGGEAMINYTWVRFMFCNCYMESNHEAFSKLTLQMPRYLFLDHKCFR